MKTAQQWMEDLNDHDIHLRLKAAEALAGLAEAAQPAILGLVQQCGSEDEDLRNWCVSALEGVGPPDMAQLDDLIALASAASENVAYWAITLLGRLDRDAISALSILIERLGDASAPAVQKRAAWALGRIGPGAATAEQALRDAASGSDRALVAQVQTSIELISAAY